MVFLTLDVRTRFLVGSVLQPPFQRGWIPVQCKQDPEGWMDVPHPQITVLVGRTAWHVLARKGLLPHPRRGEEELAQGLGLLGIRCRKGALNEFFIFLTHFLHVLTLVLVPSFSAVLPALGPCRKGEGVILQVTFPMPTGEQAASCGSPAFLSQVKAPVAQQQGNSQVEVFHF